MQWRYCSRCNVPVFSAALAKSINRSGHMGHTEISRISNWGLEADDIAFRAVSILAMLGLFRVFFDFTFCEVFFPQTSTVLKCVFSFEQKRHPGKKKSPAHGTWDIDDQAMGACHSTVAMRWERSVDLLQRMQCTGVMAVSYKTWHWKWHPKWLAMKM